ncbi:MAG: radical SAM protein [Spirochaetota bacterium]|nr:radical SAM protein [Spirochaetota bacterium]
MPYETRHNIHECTDCGACKEFVACPGANEEICIGCGACNLICPNQALELVEAKRKREVQIEVNGKEKNVPERITVKEALWESGHGISACLPGSDDLFAPCGVGACGNCAVDIDGEIRLACVTEAKAGMKIKTDLPDDYIPRRIVGPFGGHPDGGVGTSWEFRKNSTSQFIELCCIVAGCNFRCPQCHNWMITHMGKGLAFTPQETAKMLTNKLKELGLESFLLSGGEITLNRPWLIQLVQELKQLNPEPGIRLHISTNGSLLTENYIDELIDAGLNVFGIDLKALHVETFMRITGLKNRELAQRCMDTAWKAVAYISENYHDSVFMGLGVPYNEELISFEEIRRMGREIYNIDPSIQTTGMAYFHGDYRSQIMWPSFDEMKRVRHILKEAGLTTVQCFAKEFIAPSDP